MRKHAESEPEWANRLICDETPEARRERIANMTDEERAQAPMPVFTHSSLL